MTIRPVVRFAVFNRDGFACVYCGRKAPTVELECDHIVARSNGGSDAVANLVTACFECNRGKGRRALSIMPPPRELRVERRERLIDVRYVDPSKAEVSTRTKTVFDLLVSNAGERIADNIEHRIRLADIYEACNLNAGNIGNIVLGIQITSVELVGKKSKSWWCITGLVDGIEHGVDWTGELTYTFSETMRMILANDVQRELLAARLAEYFSVEATIRPRTVSLLTERADWTGLTGP